jgi:hypothetical protein
VFRHSETSENDVGAPFIPFNTLAGHRPSHRVYHEQKSNPWRAMASAYRCATDEWAVPPLEIEIETIQSSPYRSGVAGRQRTHLLLSPALATCCCPLALSGLGELFASESSPLNSGHLWWQFRPCVTRRTLSPHTAQPRSDPSSPVTVRRHPPGIPRSSHAGT